MGIKYRIEENDMLGVTSQSDQLREEVENESFKKKKHLQSVASQIPCSDSRKTKWISLLSFHFLSLY